jgi:hypothetical protein
MLQGQDIQPLRLGVSARNENLTRLGVHVIMLSPMPIANTTTKINLDNTDIIAIA